MSSKTFKEIRNFLIVILLGIALALFIVIYSLNNFGPTGQYLLKNALLNPEILPKLKLNDYNPKTGGSDRYFFSEIDFEYALTQEARLEKKVLSQDQYRALYTILENDKSVKNTDQTFNLSENPIARLIIQVKTAPQAAWQEDEKVFQEVAFSRDGNHYRVSLRESKSVDNWAYFEHPGVYKEVMKIIDGK